MNNVPIYKKGDIIEVENYLQNPLYLKHITTLRFFVDDIEDIKGKSKANAWFSQRDILNELKKKPECCIPLSREKYTRPAPSYLLSGEGYIGTDKQGNITAFNNLEKYGIYGSMGSEFTYFATDVSIALNHTIRKSFVDVELLELNLDRLSGKRWIFFDPECIAYARERDKTFIVMGGVPKESIRRIYHMKQIK